MLPYFIVLLAIGIAGMLAVVARHAREVFHLNDPTPLPTAGEVRVLDHVTGRIRQLEAYGKLKLRPLFFSSLTNSLKWGEQKLIALVRSVRKYQRELSQHARVSPRESQYWKDISDWKQKPNDTTTAADELASREQSSPRDTEEPTATGVTATAGAVVVAPEMTGSVLEEKPKRKRIMRRAPAPEVVVPQVVAHEPKKRKSALKNQESPVVDTHTPTEEVTVVVPEVKKRTRTKRTQVDEESINTDNQTS